MLMIDSATLLTIIVNVLLPIMIVSVVVGLILLEFRYMVEGILRSKIGFFLGLGCVVVLLVNQGVQ